LSDDVRKNFASRETFAGPEADRHGGIEMCAADVAECIGHGQHGKAEGERHSREANPDRNMQRRQKDRGQDGAARAPENEPKGTDELGDCATTDSRHVYLRE